MCKRCTPSIYLATVNKPSVPSRTVIGTTRLVKDGIVCWRENEAAKNKLVGFCFPLAFQESVSK